MAVAGRLTSTEKPSPYWIKVKNPRYSQLEGREELFERGNLYRTNTETVWDADLQVFPDTDHRRNQID
jgi:hypothetical protein